ncbi:MAG: transporter substrate-binding domain-containing protein, partial [Cutibacterium avidum]|nr:transporter substrate-binding domain-containing protein [Cutibacterium avidum]
GGDSGGSAETASNVGTRTPEQIKKDGTIHIGTFADKAPFGSLTGKNSYKGYDITYGERLAKDMGVKLEWVPVDAASRVEFLESGKVDIILANFTVTKDRAKKVDFANPYMQVAFGAVSPTDHPVKKVSDLDHAKILVVKGTSQDAWIQEHHPEWKVTKFEEYAEVTSALADGRGDVWITDNTEAVAFTRQNKKFITGITSFGDKATIAPAVHKGNDPLRTWINDDLVKLGKEDFFHQNFRKTLEPVYGDTIKPDQLVIEGGRK